FVQHVVAELQDGVKAVQYGDLDGDGDLDVAAAVNVASEVAWYENDGNMSFTYHLVQSDFVNAFAVEIDDIDGDGSLDIAASSANGDTLAWFANDGVGNFTMNLIDGDFEGPRGIEIVDMNGDGLKDFIAASHYEGQISWWENLFGIPPDPISIELTPDDPVISIGENGGSFDYTATITRFGPTQTFDAWTIVTYVPNGNSVITASFNSLPIQPGTHNYSLSQYIPGLAPAGDYMFSAYLGSFPWIGEVYDSFPFSKEGVMTADFSVFDETELWPTVGAIGEATETVIQTDSDTELPSEYALYDAYPNPFNPSTRISVALPENAALQVTVYNALGQQVAELVNGRMSAGVHGFTFDASDQPSGLYFIHAMVPGQFTDVKKVMLVK
ncbi:MAG TPA: T9SS type A sorting domain-containing protein, partial [Bacteroidetes bacterium]|nr:T9SS type A sorting domain-containing protein [Bacteroidota bacterium]HEX03693.1 T9SS type A sorting domain-containing protein [Bacteroidota bacterium]